jgi:hypothetical protein
MYINIIYYWDDKMDRKRGYFKVPFKFLARMMTCRKLRTRETGITRESVLLILGRLNEVGLITTYYSYYPELRRNSTLSMKVNTDRFVCKYKKESKPLST